MRRFLERSFDVAAPPENVWAHFGQIEKWPSWARHIRSVRLDPPGMIGPTSRGTFALTNHIRTSFTVTEFEAGRRFLWRGRFLGMLVDYDHVLELLPGGGTHVTFTVDGEGATARLLGPIFARIYGRDLGRAIPRLVAELEGSTGSSAPGEH